MRTFFTILFSVLCISLYAQDMQAVEKQLNAAFKKIDYWANYSGDASKLNTDDSVLKANAVFEKLLTKYAVANPQTIAYDFQLLKAAGVTIVTAEDRLFRIYSWNTLTGGTMRVFRNVFQYKSGGRWFAKVGNPEQQGDAGCVYQAIHDLEAGARKYYLTQNVAVLSSALTYHTASIYKIENGKLQPGKLIKTKTGIRSQLGYEVDRSASVNLGKEDLPDTNIVYDKNNREISIPLIQADATITGKWIRYKFTGKYFEKQ